MGQYFFCKVEHFETGKRHICLGILGLEVQFGWSEERALGNVEGRRNYQTVMTFLGRWCSALLERLSCQLFPIELNMSLSFGKF